VLPLEFFRYLILHGGVVEIVQRKRRAAQDDNALVVLIALRCLSRVLCLRRE
jgi:hypothetical protein